MMSLFFSALIWLSTMDDFMRSTGKIYVVVGVLLIIFIGILAFLFRLEQKIKHLEKKLEDEPQ